MASPFRPLSLCHEDLLKLVSACNNSCISFLSRRSKDHFDLCVRLDCEWPRSAQVLPQRNAVVGEARVADQQGGPDIDRRECRIVVRAQHGRFTGHRLDGAPAIEGMGNGLRAASHGPGGL